ncbi:hypothetical protein BG004_004671 [Podila humilis]|nr:hypothetical protein BG004_004671 [Podila humilis]
MGVVQLVPDPDKSPSAINQFCAFVNVYCWIWDKGQLVGILNTKRRSYNAYRKRIEYIKRVKLFKRNTWHLAKYGHKIQEAYHDYCDYQSTTQLGPHTGLTFVAVTTRDAITAIGNNCSKLQQLTLSGCDWLTTEEVMTLVTQCRQLFLLDLNRCSKLDSRFCQLFVVTDDMMNNSADRAVLGPDMPISLLWYMHQSIPPEHLLFNEGEDQIYDPVSLMDREKEGNLSVVHKHGRASRAIVREYGQNQGYNGRVGSNQLVDEYQRQFQCP